MAWNWIFNEILPLAWCVVCRRRETLASSWWCRCCCFSVEIIDRSIRHPTTTVLPHLWAVTLEDDDLERDWGMALLFFAQMKVRGRLFSLSSPLWLDYPSASQCTNSDLKKLSPPLALRTWPYRPLQYRFLPPFWIFLFLFLFVRSIWSSIFWLKNQYRIKGECKYPLFLPVYFIPITQSLVDGRVQFPLFYSPVCGQREQERASLLGPYSLSTSLPSISWTEASNDIAPAGGSTAGWMGKRGNSCRDQKFFGIERQTRIRLCYEMRLHPQTLIVFSFSVFSG